LSDRWLSDAGALVPLTALAHGSSLGVPAAELRGRSVLLATADQLPAALALIELDGVARRIVLCPPDLPPEHLSAVAGTAGRRPSLRTSRAPNCVGFSSYRRRPVSTVRTHERRITGSLPAPG